MGLNDVSDDLGEEGMTMFDFNILLSLGVPIITISGNMTHLHWDVGPTSQCRWVIFPENKNNKIKHCLNHLVVKIQKKYKIRKTKYEFKKGKLQNPYLCCYCLCNLAACHIASSHSSPLNLRCT